MNTKEISSAQLNVSSRYTPHTISRLIDILYQHKLIAYYNAETKSIDIEPNNTFVDNEIIVIKEQLKFWIEELVDTNTAMIICNNIDFVYNITQVTTDNGIIIKVYLF